MTICIRKKLYHLVGPMHREVLILGWRPRDIEAKVGDYGSRNQKYRKISLEYKLRGPRSWH